MAVVVVGGQSRNVGKTSVVAGIIARLPQIRWTAIKITQSERAWCSGPPCDCANAGHTVAIVEEGDPSGRTDSARFVAAGAVGSLWVRTLRGSLAEAMPRIRDEIAAAENTILESNSVLEFLQPDVYLSVLDPATADFKDSGRLYLERADAILLHSDTVGRAPLWIGVPHKLVEGKPQFLITPPNYVSDEIVEFLRSRGICCNRR